MRGPFDNEMDNAEWERDHPMAKLETTVQVEVEVGDPLMQQAWELTNGDRRGAYGDPREVFDAYGLAWTAVLRQKLKPGETITGLEVTLMMAMLKICREAQNVKADNIVDGHGYLSLHSRIAGLVEGK